MDLVDGRAVQPRRLYGRIVDAEEQTSGHADDCATVAKDCAATFCPVIVERVNGEPFALYPIRAAYGYGARAGGATRN